MQLMRVLISLLCLLGLSACAGGAAPSSEGTDAFVHQQLDRRGL